MIESQVHYIVQCLKLLREKNAKYMNVRTHALRRYNEELEHRLEDTVWTSGCESWYTQEDGKNIAIWPGFSFRYRARTRTVEADHYVWTPNPERVSVRTDGRNAHTHGDRHRRSAFGGVGGAD
jgi:hypothetical protein